MVLWYHRERKREKEKRKRERKRFPFPLNPYPFTKERELREKKERERERASPRSSVKERQRYWIASEAFFYLSHLPPKERNNLFRYDTVLIGGFMGATKVYLLSDRAECIYVLLIWMGYIIALYIHYIICV